MKASLLVLLLVLVLVPMLLTGGVAHARQFQLPPPPMMECLSPSAAVRGTPAYPFDALKFGHEGTVGVELEFVDADSPPRITVRERPKLESFVDAVKDHVAAWRFPCAGTLNQPVRLAVNFVFKPEERRSYSSQPEEVENARWRKLVACITPDLPKRTLPYAVDAQGAGDQGRVLALLRFESGTEPPKLTLLARSNAHLLGNAVRPITDELRLPCCDGRPFEVVGSFIFRLGGDVFGFKLLTFRNQLPFI